MGNVFPSFGGIGNAVKRSVIRLYLAASVVFVRVPSAFADDATGSTGSTGSSSTEIEQLWGMCGKIIALALLLGAVFGVIAIIKAGYAYAISDNPHEARGRLVRAVLGTVLAIISVPLVIYIWDNILSPYGYSLG